MNKLILKSFMTFSIMTVLFSCNSNTTNDDSKKEATVDTAAVALVPESTQSMMMTVKHDVANFEKWKTGYEEHDSVRRSFGLTKMNLLRLQEKPNSLFLVFHMESVERAKEFSVLPALKDVMTKLGVISAPEFSYNNIVRNDIASIAAKDMVMITHRVKDFDTWLKAYDAEGITTRASQGMIDRYLCRGIEDSNFVTVGFAVTDLAKAKAAIFSASKKKIMTDAGVEGTPKIEFYQINE